jgi:hypothetical protein
MGINTTKYVRKPLYVEAVQVTEGNFDEMVAWCNGAVEIEEGNGKKFIRIWVHNPMGPRQTKAFVGDWILRHQKGFKIYTQKAFEASFDEVPVTTPPVEIVKEEVVRTPANLEGSAETYTTPANLEERLTVEPATPQAIADVVNEQQPVKEGVVDGDAVAAEMESVDAHRPPTEELEVVQTTQVDENLAVKDTPTSPPVETESRRILSLAEQQQMGPDEVRALLRAGEAVLAQDLTEHVA